MGEAFQRCWSEVCCPDFKGSREETRVFLSKVDLFVNLHFFNSTTKDLPCGLPITGKGKFGKRFWKLSKFIFTVGVGMRKTSVLIETWLEIWVLLSELKA
jgi:hypothetical protein